MMETMQSANPVQAPAAPLRAHRGGTIITLGILGLTVWFVFGLIAWLLANEDLKQMEQGSMDQSGRALAEAGRTCGIIALGLGVLRTSMIMLLLLFYVVMIAAIFRAGITGGMGMQP